MQGAIPVIGLIILAIIINIPCGYLRQNYRKYSFMWFFMIHLPIPFIILLRIEANMSWHVIPLTLAGAVVGQIVGGLVSRRRRRDAKTE